MCLPFYNSALIKPWSFLAFKVDIKFSFDGKMTTEVHVLYVSAWNLS